jgi:hypothetical protein
MDTAAYKLTRFSTLPAFTMAVPHKNTQQSKLFPNTLTGDCRIREARNVGHGLGGTTKIEHIHFSATNGAEQLQIQEII